MTRPHLDRTPVVDLSPLAGLPGLRTLELSDTRVTDLSPLAGLTGLRRLWLDHTHVIEDEVRKLKACLPRLTI
jgi:Leucine-rich repeat (LRR) protein